MKKLLLLPFFAFLLFSFCYDCHMSKKLTGNWISQTDLIGIQPGDTLRLRKKKYSEKLYQWGGAISGFAFDENGDFREYSNVLCSTESDPVRFHDEHWRFDDDTIFITGSTREMKFVVIGNMGPDRKTLLLKVVKGETNK